MSNQQNKTEKSKHNENKFLSYMESPLTLDEKTELDKNKSALINNGNFDSDLGFGTGGVRDKVEHGTNRLNKYNVARLVKGFADVILENKIEPGDYTMVIAYDSRLSSLEFSRVCYHYARNLGLNVKVFKRPTPTPLLSFAIRQLKADAGIVITASHNPPEYNGFKAYWSDGGQIVSPLDKEIETRVQNVNYKDIPMEVNNWALTPVPDHDIIEDEIVKEYLNKLEKESFITHSLNKDVPILYSALHGTGTWLFKQAFHKLGYHNFRTLDIQAEPDGNFPTLNLPNPEEPKSFDELVKEGKNKGSQLLLATDPDADRVGCAVWDKDHYTFLSGNQIGALLMNHMIQTKSRNLKSPFICKTIVTSKFQNQIAKDNGIRVIETLTGFKYIADALKTDPENYLFGGEESFGYLPVNWVRDKDSLTSAVALCEIACENSLLDKLKELHFKYGLYHETLHSIILTSSSKEEDNKPSVMDKLKNPESCLGPKVSEHKIVDILDLRENGKFPLSDDFINLKESLPVSTVIQYKLEPEGVLTIRPSGTEPKVKIYISLRHPDIPNEGNYEIMKKELAAQAESIQKELMISLFN